MKRRIALHAFTLSVFTLATFSSARAQEDPTVIDDSTLSAAEQAGVDPVALKGAENSTGLDAQSYLCSTGEGPCPRPQLFRNIAQADCIISEESDGLDVPNSQGSGAWGPGQYFLNTWSWHVALYRAATGFSGALSLHVLADVRRVMAYVLTIPNMRSHWSVGGC